jgi:hypothetical protein
MPLPLTVNLKLQPSLANTCTKHTTLTLDLHDIRQTVLVFTAQSGQPEYGGALPSGHEARPAGITAPHVIRLTKCSHRLSHQVSDVLAVQCRLLNLTLLVLHSVPLQKRCCIHSLTHTYLRLLLAPCQPSRRQRQRESKHCLLHQP